MIFKGHKWRWRVEVVIFSFFCLAIATWVMSVAAQSCIGNNQTWAIRLWAGEICFEFRVPRNLSSVDCNPGYQTSLSWGAQLPKWRMPHRERSTHFQSFINGPLCCSSSRNYVPIWLVALFIALLGTIRIAFRLGVFLVRRQKHQCTNCGYSIGNAIEMACPECGQSCTRHINFTGDSTTLLPRRNGPQ